MRPDSATLSAAAKFLAHRDRLESEVRRHLVEKGFDASNVESVVQFLIERKLINDNKTTQSLIESRSGKRSVGIEKLRAELERLGAPEDVIESNLAAMSQSEPERALAALTPKYKLGADRGKAGRFLFSRGFSEEAIETALDAFCDGPE